MPRQDLAIVDPITQRISLEGSVNDYTIRRIQEAVREALGERPMTRRDLLEAISGHRNTKLDAIRLLVRLEGIILDPVYEGKSMAGLIDLVGSGEIGNDSTVLYAHLGGQPALSACLQAPV